MAFTAIPTLWTAVGKPVSTQLMNRIRTNLDSLDSRLNAVSLAAGSNVLINEQVEMPEDALPVGTVVYASLSEAQFVAANKDGEWKLADGSSVAGSDWAVLTGKSTVPDVRGRFLRAKAHASGNNTAGDLALDSYTADTYLSHDHGAGSYSAVSNGAHDHLMFTATPSSNTLNPGRVATDNIYVPSLGTRGAADYWYFMAGGPSASGLPNAGVTSSDGAHTHSISGASALSGSTETSPRYVTENCFIKINRKYIEVNTRLFVKRIDQTTTINSILVTPVSQGTSGNFKINVKKGATPATATQSIFVGATYPTLAYTDTTGQTAATDSGNSVVEAGEYIVVSVTETQAKLGAVHVYLAGDY